MSNKIVVESKSSELLIAESENEVKETARKLMKITSGGSHLTADQAADLAVYALLTGLNPFNGECYYLDKVGPIPGVAGYRVKTINWLMIASNNDPTTRTWEEYRPATPEEADFDPSKGDIAWVCTLYDSISSERWEQRVMTAAERYHKMGAEFKEARAAALEDVGSRPSWSAVGVVHAEEHFSKQAYENNVPVPGQYKPEMWDRNERAKKRATKGAYRKGFPMLNIPDPEYGEVIEGVARDVTDVLTQELLEEQNKPQPPPRSPEQIIKELGYPTTPAPIGPGVFTRPMSPTSLKLYIEQLADTNQRECTPRDKQVLAAALDAIFDGDKTKRYELCNWMVGYASTKEMPSAYVLSILQWLGITDFNQPPTMEAMAEAHAALDAALMASGQQKLL